MPPYVVVHPATKEALRDEMELATAAWMPTQLVLKRVVPPGTTPHQVLLGERRIDFVVDRLFTSVGGTWVLGRMPSGGTIRIIIPDDHHSRTIAHVVD